MAANPAAKVRNAAIKGWDLPKGILGFDFTKHIQKLNPSLSLLLRSGLFPKQSSVIEVS